MTSTDTNMIGQLVRWLLAHRYSTAAGAAISRFESLRGRWSSFMLPSRSDQNVRNEKVSRRYSFSGLNQCWRFHLQWPERFEWKRWLQRTALLSVSLSLDFLKSSDKNGGQHSCTSFLSSFCSSHPFIWRLAVTHRPSTEFL